MYPYDLLETMWAISRDRKEEARRLRPERRKAGRARDSIRSWVATLLVQAGVCLDRSASERALRAAPNGNH